MNEERIKEVFSDEAFVKELFSKETPEQVQAMLADKDIDISVEEIVKLGKVLAKKQDQTSEELGDEDLEDVSGGVVGAILIGMLAFSAVCISVSVTETATNGRW